MRHVCKRQTDNDSFQPTLLLSLYSSKDVITPAGEDDRTEMIRLHPDITCCNMQRYALSKENQTVNTLGATK